MDRQILRMAAMGLALLTLGACASSGSRAQGDDDDGRMDRTRRGLANAATTPLRDVGLIRPDIPEVLEGIRYPYSTATLAGGCPNVLYEIGQLDAVLGDETYQPDARGVTTRGMDAASDATVSAAGDLAGDAIPFRGWVRRLSGAQRADSRYAGAIEMGELRRAFLRGYGASLGCRAIVPPPPPGSAVRTPTSDRPMARNANEIGAPR